MAWNSAWAHLIKKNVVGGPGVSRLRPVLAAMGPKGGVGWAVATSFSSWLRPDTVKRAAQINVSYGVIADAA